MIVKEDVLNEQKAWADSIIKIGKMKDDPSKYIKETETVVERLYNCNEGQVLFKPTKVSKKQFRLTKEGVISYFIGGNADFPEDSGFALQPWSKVRFENADIILDENRAYAMGNYFFMDLDNNETKAEYTFGYIKNTEGILKIFIHHSSFPFEP